MGADKAMLTIPDGRTLLTFIIDQMQTCLPDVGVSAARGRYSLGGTPIIEDRRLSAGPCAGIEAGLHWAQGMGAGWLLTWPVDVPLIPARWLGQLLEHTQKSGVLSSYIIAKGASPDQPRSQQLFAAWSVHGLKIVTRYLDEDEHSVLGLHETLGAVPCDVSGLAGEAALAKAFLNVNTAEDHATMRAMWR